jgi:hypothetical protein
MLDDETCLTADFWQAVGLTLKRRATGACTACGAGERQCPWHQFIDHLAEGNTPEAFFTGLTSSQPLA